MKCDFGLFFDTRELTSGFHHTQALRRISNHHRRRREVARQTDFPAKCLGGELFCRKTFIGNGLQLSEKFPATKLRPSANPQTSRRMGGFFATALQSPQHTRFELIVSTDVLRPD